MERSVCNLEQEKYSSSFRGTERKGNNIGNYEMVADGEFCTSKRAELHFPEDETNWKQRHNESNSPSLTN